MSAYDPSIPDTEEQDIPSALDQEAIEAAENNWAIYVRWRDAGHTEYVDIARMCEAYYLGDQWSKEDKARLESQKRPALTINIILSTINVILGEQANKRASYRFKSRNGTHEESMTADGLTRLFLQIEEETQLSHVESQVFSNGLIQDRGFFDIRMDFKFNQQGNIAIESVDPVTLLLDPDAKDYDPTTWKGVIRTHWVSLDDISEEYGEEVADKITANAWASTSFGFDSIITTGTHTFDTADEPSQTNTWDTATPSRAEQKQVRSVRIIERQYKRLTTVDYMVDPITGEEAPIPEHWPPDKVAYVVEQSQVQIEKRRVQRIRWTITADRQVLYDDWSPYRYFTVVPFFPYFRSGRPLGLVRNLLSPQDQYNKISSQELHVINTTANSGWVIQAGSLTNMTDDELREQGAETGLVLVTAPNATPPQKIAPNPIPTGLRDISDRAGRQIREISGVNQAIRGEEPSYASGEAIKAQQARAHVQMQVPLDHLKLTRRIMAIRILDLIQNFYTEPRLVTVTRSQQPQAQEENVMLNEQTSMGRALDVTKGKYDIVITEMPDHKTLQEEQFAAMLEMRGAGLAIPDDRIIEASDMPNKHAIAEEVRQALGRGEPTPEEQQLLEQQQQIEQQLQLLTVAKLQAEVQGLQAQAQLAQAKANTELDPNAPEHSIKIQQINSELQARQQELEVRLRIAELQAKQSLDKETLAAQGKRITVQSQAQEQGRQQRQKVALESALTRLNPANSTTQ